MFFLIFNYFLFPCRAGAAVGAAATANAGGIVAAGGAALSAGAGAIASAASSFFGSVSGAGDGASSAAPSGGPRLAMSNQRSFKIGSFRFAAFVPKKIECKRF